MVAVVPPAAGVAEHRQRRWLNGRKRRRWLGTRRREKAAASSAGSGGVGGSGGLAGSSGASGSVGTGGSGAPGSCPANGWKPGDQQKLMLAFGGLNRTYDIHIPASYTGTTPVPLVMTIHGAHNTTTMVRSWSKMNTVSDQNGFIVVYPQGVDCWNAGFTIGGCAAAPDDVGFLKAVVADVESHACIDPKRVYATGISNGSMMSQYLDARHPTFSRRWAVSPVERNADDPAPGPALYVQGTQDMTISYSSAQPDVDGWVMRDGCSTTPMETYNMGSTRCATYGGCREGAEVVFCTVTGMGHCWPEDSNCGPGGGPTYGVTDFKASPMMWEFFQRHPLP